MTDDTALTSSNNAVAAGGNQAAEMWKFAQALSRATIIPKAYQQQPANCFVALDMAQRLGTGVMEIMQNTYVVHGTPGFSAKYVIGMCNQRGPFKGPIQFDWNPDPKNSSVTAWATVRETDQRVEFTVDMNMAKAEGWTSNSKYKSLPQSMLSYRAGVQLVRLYAPETMLGMQTAEELEDARAVQASVVPLDQDFVVRDVDSPKQVAEPKAEPQGVSATELWDSVKEASEEKA